MRVSKCVQLNVEKEGSRKEICQNTGTSSCEKGGEIINWPKDPSGTHTHKKHTHTGLETPQERGKPKGKIKSFFSAAFGFVQKYSMVLTPAFFSVDPREKKQFGARYPVLEEVRERQVLIIL